MRQGEIMSIQENILAVMDQVQKDPTGKVGEDLRTQAISAIYSGVGSGDWNAYMNNFAKTPQELARLMAQNADCDPYIRQARAYLVANGTCGAGTTRTLLFSVENILDKTLPVPPTP
jgi:hypothetical protein